MFEIGDTKQHDQQQHRKHDPQRDRTVQNGAQKNGGQKNGAQKKGARAKGAAVRAPTDNGNPSPEFVLLVIDTRRTADADGDDTDAPKYRTLTIPAAPGYLLAGPRRLPRITHRRPRPCPGIVLEPVSLRNRSYVLMLLGDDVVAQYNGVPAQPVTLMRVGDEVYAGGYRFFVSMHRSSGLTTASGGQVGTTCPFCRLQVAAGAPVYACSCGTVLHREDPTLPPESRLPCASLASTCPKCKQDIRFDAGLMWEPEA